MEQIIKVVLDVNVWISALLWGGVPGKILRLAREKKIIIFTSNFLLVELETTLNRTKFRERLQQRNCTVANLMSKVAQLSSSCVIIDVKVPEELRDPKDGPILATSLGGNVDVLITGDLDLLVLEEFCQIPILTPTDFCIRYFPDLELMR